MSSGFFYIEAYLLIFLFIVFYFSLKDVRGKFFIAVAPIILFYSLYDIYFIVFNEPFTFIQFNKVSELLQVIDIKIAILLLISGITIFIYLFYLEYSLKSLLLFALITFFCLCSMEFSSFTVSFIKKYGKEINSYSSTKNIIKNGRITMSLYWEAERRVIKKTLNEYKNQKKFTKKLPNNFDKFIDSNNVHLIILESYIDPTLFRNLDINKNILKSNKYKKMFADKENLSISPVFGGNTSQAEFEALCGVHAFNKLSSAEFNVFSGRKTECLPNILTRFGYVTNATNAFGDTMFNTELAYRSIGFENRYYPNRKNSYFKKLGKEQYMFDGYLFEQNLQFVKKQLKNKKPFLNYVLSIYGHTPFDIDYSKYPDIIKNNFTDNVQMKNLLNQYYYRTKALAAYLNELIILDPHSIIIVVADHLPPINNNEEYNKFRYKYSLYTNRLLIIKNGQVIKLKSIIHHYDIPTLILNYLSNNKYCQCIECFNDNNMLENYYTILSLGRKNED